jgi:hypothetical protein
MDAEALSLATTASLGLCLRREATLLRHPLRHGHERTENEQPHSGDCVGRKEITFKLHFVPLTDKLAVPEDALSSGRRDTTPSTPH